MFPAIFPHAWEGITTVEVDGEQVPWTSHNELNSELQANNAIFTENFEQNILASADASGAMPILQQLDAQQQELNTSEEAPAGLQDQINQNLVALGPYVEKLSQNPEAIKVGGRLFLQNCALCHGSRGRCDGLSKLNRQRLVVWR